MQQEQVFPAIRSDLHIIDTGYQASGEAGYVVHDPLRHKFYWLRSEALRVLVHWRGGKASQISASSGLSADVAQQAAQFLSDARLLTVPVDGSKALIDEKVRAQRSLSSIIVHNYLFFRVPLFDPTWLLDFLLPVARVLASRLMLLLIGLVGAAGMYFSLQQWDQYAATFLRAFSLEGALMFGTTIAVLKCFHELGHGLVARAQGIRVPVMGVAFMMLAPMLYTEVSDAWRLKSRQGRFWIAAAGVSVEIGIAAVALFLWAFLPDGPWRNVAFFVSSTAWIMSVMVNLSPLMRFDGYHMLGDALGVQNIGPRSFALANWKLRQVMFGLGDPLPERLPPWLHRFLIVFAWVTCLYRLVLFVGIAYLVYTMFPKIIGLPLAVIEIWFFILMPVVREVRSWARFGLGTLFRSLRARINLVLIMLAGVLICLPLDRHEAIPAVVFPGIETKVFAPEPAQVARVYLRKGAAVQAGEALITLRSPALEHAHALLQIRVALLDVRMRRIASDERERGQMPVLLQEQRALADELAGLEARLDRLIVRSAFQGRVREVMRGLRSGQWVTSTEMLIHVTGFEGVTALGLAPESAVTRLETGAAAVFVAEDGVRAAIPMNLKSIGSPGSSGGELAYLSSQSGGPVVTAKDATGKTATTRAMLPVMFASDSAQPQQALRGTVTAEAKPKSLLSMAMERVVAVALRESGM